MTQASNIFIKDTIIKLLTAIGSEKEIKKYINKFSSTEQQFAVIKVGGAVVEEDLDNLISSLVFLNQVGLRPIIIHGGGPGLSKELDAKKKSTSGKDWFKTFEAEAYSAFDEETGLPTHDAKGKELSQAIKNKLKKV